MLIFGNFGEEDFKVAPMVYEYFICKIKRKNIWLCFINISN